MLPFFLIIAVHTKSCNLKFEVFRCTLQNFSEHKIRGLSNKPFTGVTQKTITRFGNSTAAGKFIAALPSPTAYNEINQKALRSFFTAGMQKPLLQLHNKHILLQKATATAAAITDQL